MNASSAVDWVIVRPVILTSGSLKIYEEFQQSAVSNTAHSTLFVESQEGNSGKFRVVLRGRFWLVHSSITVGACEPSSFVSALLEFVGRAKLHLAQGQSDRRYGGGDQHQRPKHIDVGEERRLRLHLLGDPGKSLLLRLRQ